MSATDSTPGATISRWSAAGLPTGLSINSSGLISGTPETPGTYSATVTATDSNGAYASDTFAWILSNTVTVTNPGTVNATTGTAFSYQIVASDSSSTATFTSYSAAGLPSTLSVNTSTGLITGTPTAPTTVYVSIGATDSAGYVGSTVFQLVISNLVTVTNPGTQSNVTGSAISTLSISATDSQSGATLTYGATGLPAGLTIAASTGHITGTPTTAGSNSVTVTATDDASYSGHGQLHLEHHQHGQRHQPGHPVQRLGHGHLDAADLGHRHPVGGHLDLLGHRSARPG